MKIIFIILMLALLPHSILLAQDLKVATAFESGSARVISIDSNTKTIKIIPAGNPQRGMPNWWFLRVDGIIPDEPFFLEVMSAAELMPSGPPGTFRKMSPNWTWPDRATYSIDGKNWLLSEAGKKEGECMRYKLVTGSPTLWIAWGPPFTPQDMSMLSERLTEKYSFIKKLSLAQSREGRTVSLLNIREGDKPVLQRPAIWVQARQHAWETGGSWVAVGLAEWLTSNDSMAIWLRKNTDIYIVPLMDVDHVITGDGGKNAIPHDHNRDWTCTPYYPEVLAAQQFILQLTAEDRMNIFLDLHNPAAGNKQQTIYVLDKTYMGEEAFARQERFIELMQDEFQQLKQNRNGVKPAIATWEERVSEAWVLANANANTIGFCIETPWNSVNSTTSGYRAVGEKLGRIAGRLLYISEKELQMIK